VYLREAEWKKKKKKEGDGKWIKDGGIEKTIGQSIWSPVIHLARRTFRPLHVRLVLFEQKRNAHNVSSTSNVVVESSSADSNPAYDFVRRHVGPNEQQTKEMLRTLGLQSLEELTEKTVPSAIRFHGSMNIPEALCKHRFCDAFFEMQYF
jgi:hypothetical protein